jgi:SpoVK/Ycf46/Vps4 family AAA+-type ATPase
VDPRCGGLLLYGPPGTGKTSIAEDLFLRMGAQVIARKAGADFNRPHVGETEKLLLQLAAAAEEVPGQLCVVIIDEADALTPRRNDSGVSSFHLDVLSTLLGIVGSPRYHNLLFCLTTNRYAAMDDALKRSQRISPQAHVFVGRLDAESRKRFCQATWINIAKERSINNMPNLASAVLEDPHVSTCVPY